MGAALDFLQEAGVALTLAAPDRLAATGRLTDDARQYIREHKAELLRELAAANDQPKLPRRTILHFRLTSTEGGNAGGSIISDDEIEALVLELVERYGARLDLDELLERVRERFAIVAESAPDAEALRVTLAEAEAVIRRAAGKDRR